ncbi:MAG: hypothetical protein N2200_03940 [Bacteroidia bacterium]|nr:hypothetical protein [Bacteroidia bacterium]
MPYLLLLWGQLCGLLYDLRYQDTLWQEGHRTWRAVKRLKLQDKRSGLPVYVSALFENAKPVLLSVCHDGENTYWSVAWKGDTLEWVSRRLSHAWLRRYMVAIRGPRTWCRGPQPSKEVQIVIPLAQRPQVPEDTLWQWNLPWRDSLILPWIQTLRLPSGCITAMGLHVRYFANGKVSYEKISVYVQRHLQLPFDEESRVVLVSKLPRAYRQRFLSLRKRLPTYAYVVRIQDYYPLSLTEAQAWMYLLRQKQSFPLPSELSSLGNPALVALLPD